MNSYSGVRESSPKKPYSVSIVEVPITIERRPYIPREGDNLIDPGTARATIAASNENPNGTNEGNWQKEHEKQTVLQQHVSYWDFDNDGIIWPYDTYRGCRAWGWSIPLCLLVAFIINFNLSYPTCPGWLPDPLFRIWVDRIHKSNHGSDSLSFDNEGRFRPQQFEDFFAKYDNGNKGGLDVWDLLRAWKGQRFIFDFFGWSAGFVEWLATYLLLWPKDGILKKDEVRRVFDGSIFQYMADQHAEEQQQKKEERRNRMKFWMK